MIDVDCLSEAAVVLVEIDGVLAGFIGSPVETKSTLRESASGNDRRPSAMALSAMARELVERNGIGETADAVWKALNTKHQKLFPTASDCNDDASSAGLASVLVEGPVGPSLLSGRSYLYSHYRRLRTAP